MTSHVNLREYGSIPDVGSSRKTTFGRPMNAIASESFLRCPPDRSPVLYASFSESATSFTAAITSRPIIFFGIPPNAAYSSRCSFTVSVGHRTSNCGQIPSDARIVGMSVLIDRPFIFASPPLALSMPVRMLIVVVFPAPLCPSRPET